MSLNCNINLTKGEKPLKDRSDSGQQQSRKIPFFSKLKNIASNNYSRLQKLLKYFLSREGENAKNSLLFLHSKAGSCSEFSIQGQFHNCTVLCLSFFLLSLLRIHHFLNTTFFLDVYLPCFFSFHSILFTLTGLDKLEQETRDQILRVRRSKFLHF